MAVRVGSFDSLDDLENTLKRGGSSYMRRVGDTPLVGRFVEEPQDWKVYLDHWDEDAQRGFPCSDDCVGCEEGLRTSKRYLTNFYVTAEGTVIPLMLPSTLALQIVKKAKRYGTVLDRDYELWKEGSGKNGTSYDSDALEPSTIRGWSKIVKEKLDLTKILADALEDYLNGGNTGKAPLPGEKKRVVSRKVETIADDDDDDEDEKPAKRRGGTVARKATASTARAAVKARSKAASKPVDDDDEDDEDDAPATGARAARAKARAKTAGAPRARAKTGGPARRAKKVEPEDDEEVDIDLGEEGNAENSERAEELAEEGLRGCKRILKEVWSFDPADYRGWDLDTCIDKIIELEASGGADDGTDEADEDDDADDVGTDEADEDDDADDEEESEDFSEEELLEMSLAELRPIAKEFGVRITPRMSVKQVVAKIMEAAEVEE